MFGKIKNKLSGKGTEIEILAPVEGTAIPVQNVPDPTFSEEMLGKGIAIKPTGGKVVAPVDGKISLMFETGHAVNIISNNDVEILIHIGLDTIKLKGKHYKAHVKDGDDVKAGDLLIEFDLDGISKDGYETVTPVIVCNPDEFDFVNLVTQGTVEVLAPIMKFKKKD